MDTALKAILEEALETDGLEDDLKAKQLIELYSELGARKLFSYLKTCLVFERKYTEQKRAESERKILELKIASAESQNLADEWQFKAL